MEVLIPKRTERSNLKSHQLARIGCSGFLPTCTVEESPPIYDIFSFKIGHLLIDKGGNRTFDSPVGDGAKIVFKDVVFLPLDSVDDVIVITHKGGVDLSIILYLVSEIIEPSVLVVRVSVYQVLRHYAPHSPQGQERMCFLEIQTAIRRGERIGVFPPNKSAERTH